jgi:predicted MFS family arabinose efflux permease
MQAGLIVLCLAYVLSQFFRAFLAVLTTALGQDIGATAEDLAFASGLWFLGFAAMQLPVGWCLDKIGPRRSASTIIALGAGGGAAVFALATAPWHIALAMAMIGAGCSPALMASYFIFAREYPPARFATLAALMLGVASVGNLIASWPMAVAAETIGWRAALGGLAVASVAVAAGIFALVRDPAPVAGNEKGTLLDLLRMPVIWLILPLMAVAYAPSGAVRGLWIGPYLTDVFGLTTQQVGQATLAMGIAMIAGTLAYGPLDRIFGTRKGVALVGNAVCAAAMLVLAALIEAGPLAAVALMALAGAAGASYPLVIAHGRAFFPAHLAGRGVTLMNLFAMGGVGLMQFLSGRLHTATAGADPALPYQAIFLFFGLSLAAGVAIYAFSRDNMN